MSKTFFYVMENYMMKFLNGKRTEKEVKKTVAAGVPKATILTYFYSEVTVEKMSFYRLIG